MHLPNSLKSIAAAMAAVSLLGIPGSTHAQTAKITVEVDKPGIKVSPHLYGIFFEEISRSGDGGIYAEMLQNRSFEDAPTPNAWSLVSSGGAGGTIRLDKSKPLNPKNPTALQLEITSSTGGRVGIANQGFKGARWNRQWVESTERTQKQIDEFASAFTRAAEQSASGIAVENGKQYRFSLYARGGGGFTAPLTVSIEKQDGTLLASETLTGLGPEWKPFQCFLKANASETNARLVVSASAPGTVYFDMVSLFPKETFKGRENGIRKDLGEMIAAMKPGFMRFPGGCFVEGNLMGNAFRWKKTVGALAEREGHHTYWGYFGTGGLGYHEYLQFCEDIGAAPLFVTNCGMAHGDKIPMDQLQEYIGDALDAIEYANGPVESKWGAMRAKAGHPKPFNLKLLQVGNENGGPLYDERYAAFYDAIKAKYPEVKLVANLWGGVPKSRSIDILDEHYYRTPEFFMREANRYDKYDRNTYKIYCGEYAVTQGSGMGNLISALGESAFMTGMERNSDVVIMSSYAPLLVHPEWRGWNPNAIVFDSARVYGTPSYHAQAMFANHRADILVPIKVESPEAQPRPIPGQVGLATYNSQVEFKDMMVTKEGKVLYQWEPSLKTKGWKVHGGKWEVQGEVICQTGTGERVKLLLDQPITSDYTYSLKARKIGGSEGFMICFQNQGAGDRTWWNLGGWGNRRHALQGSDMGEHPVEGSIETGRWYDIKIEVKSSGVTCYLDGKQIQQNNYKKIDSLYATAGLSETGKEVILKVVNVSDLPMPTTLNLQGAKKVAPTAKAWVMTGTREAENSLIEPIKVAPISQTISGVSSQFTHTFPSNSVTILRVPTQE